MSTLKPIAPGYYVVERSVSEREKAEVLTREQVKDLLTPVRSRAVAEEIARRYEDATRDESNRAKGSHR